ncbi:MAG: flippase [Methanobrevibacter sp.]|uniref:flippase n=1 Tax=Methanobrevibacter sp. TaxID=66852 RepID=UPI0025D32A2B|nr:flippase [Methanobrevibacter sp.]MBR3112612.1 flippase [Methanobrevibacter sp.]
MASNVRTIFANMSWLMVSQILTSVCAFVWTILSARYLGPSEYGIFGTAVSISSIFGVFATFGVFTYLVRAISTDFENEDKYINNTLSLKIFLAIFYLFMIFITLLVLGWNRYVIGICLLYAIEYIIKTYHDVFFSSFQAHEEIKYQAITNIIITIFTLAGIVFVTFTDWGLLGITAAYLFANFVALIYATYAMRAHFIKPKLKFDFSFYKTLLKAGIPFALTGLFYTIYYSIDIVMITQMSTTYNAGLYNSAYKLISVLALFYTIYTAVIFPVMSKLFEGEKDLLALSFVKSIKYLSIITIPIAVFTCFYGYDLIGIYGAQFIEAGGVLKILIWTVCFLFVNGACSMILNASHEEYSVTKIYSIAAVFNIILNLILIPRYSVYGASVATVLSEVLILILELYMIRKIGQLPDMHLVYDILKVCGASLILGIALYALDLNMWFAIAVSIVVYFAAIILLRTFDRDDKLIVKQIIGR